MNTLPVIVNGDHVMIILETNDPKWFTTYRGNITDINDRTVAITVDNDFEESVTATGAVEPFVYTKENYPETVAIHIPWHKIRFIHTFV